VIDPHDLEGELEREHLRNEVLALRMAALQQLASSLLDADSVDDVASAAREAARRMFGARDVQLWSRRGDGLVREGAAGPVTVAPPGDGSPTTRAIDSGEIQVVPARQRRVRSGDHTSRASVATLHAPFRHDGVEGALVLDVEQSADVSDEEVRLLGDLAKMVGRAVARLRAHERERVLRERADLLQRLTVACAAARTPEDVATTIVDELLRAGALGVEVELEHSGTRAGGGGDGPSAPGRVVELDLVLDEQVAGHVAVRLAPGQVLDPDQDVFWRALARACSDALQRTRLYVELEELARSDPLTGLSNRRAFDEHLRRGLARLERTDDLLAVLYVDLDRFKDVNDRFGHHVGDEILIRVAATLRGLTRPTDVAARLGGDEFAVLVESIRTDQDAHALAGRIGAAIAQRVGSLIGISVTASIGVAVTDRSDTDPDVLLRSADRAMYVEKGSSGAGDGSAGRGDG